MIYSGRNKLITEVAIVTICLVAITSALQALTVHPFVAKYYGLIFALIFLYVPVVVSHRRGREIDFLDKSIVSYLKSILVFLIAAVIVFPFFWIAAHLWQKIIYHSDFAGFSLMPNFWKAAVFQLIMIALPEEFFFRGYMQSALNNIFSRKWRILGADLGWGWIITAVIFAVSHSFVVLQWWHFAIFFPALLFGYLRERTGSITAPILFHGTSNIVMALIAHMYI